MKNVLKYKPLGVPAIIWALQLLYVAAALGLFYVLWITIGSQAARLSLQALYVAAMVAINIVWRVAVRSLKPEWF